MAYEDGEVVDGREALDRLVAEANLARQVEELLETCGWRWCHYRPARTVKGWRTTLSGDKGAPDYEAVRDGRYLRFELKSDKGRLSYDQREWFDALKQVEGIEVYLWRPSDWDEIVATLAPPGESVRVT